MSAAEEPGQTTVYEISDGGFVDAIEIRQIVQLLEFQNNDSVRDALEEKEAETASLMMRNALISRLVLLVSRVYSTPSRDADLHVGRAIELLNDAAVRTEIETRVSIESVAHAIELWKRLRGDHRLARIKHFRDRYTAHLGKPKPEIPLPEYRQLFDFARETTVLMDALARATGARTEGIDTWDEELKNSAAAFWLPWTSDGNLLA
jgi:hypothetical protein